VISQRKLVMLASGLGSLLTLAALTVMGNLPQDALDTLAWAVVFLTGSAMGANVGEHFAKRVPQKKE
jgi:hypothetical protein